MARLRRKGISPYGGSWKRSASSARATPVRKRAQAPASAAGGRSSRTVGYSAARRSGSVDAPAACTPSVSEASTSSCPSSASRRITPS